MPPLQACFQIVKGERLSWRVLKGRSGLSRGLEWGTLSLKLSFSVWKARVGIVPASWGVCACECVRVRVCACVRACVCVCVCVTGMKSQGSILHGTRLIRRQVSLSCPVLFIKTLVTLGFSNFWRDRMINKALAALACLSECFCKQICKVRAVIQVPKACDHIIILSSQLRH